MQVLVIGLGRIGLPQAVVLAKTDKKVFGWDKDLSLIEQLKKGKAPFQEPLLAKYIESTLNRTFFPVEDYSIALRKADAVVFAIGTPLELVIDESFYEAVVDYLAGLVRELLSREYKKGLLLVFRTTLPVGTIRRLKEFIEGELGLEEGEDVFLSFVPERLMEGRAIEEEESLPRIVGVFSDRAFLKVKELFDGTKGKFIRVSSPETAEMCKLVDNSYRNTLFAFANNIALLCGSLGLDAMEVIKSVNDSYPRNNIPVPGPVSGYCLGKDPYILEVTSLNANIRNDIPNLWYVGRKLNDYISQWVLSRIESYFDEQEHWDKKSVAVLGLSFKEDIDDYRMSLGVDLVEKLLRGGYRVKIFDPFWNSNKYTRVSQDVERSIMSAHTVLNEEIFKDVGAIVVTCRHKSLLEAREKVLNYFSGLSFPILLIDLWNVWRWAQGIDGITYEGLGFLPNQEEKVQWSPL